MAVKNYGSFAVAVQGNYTIKTTSTQTAAGAVVRNDVYASETITNDLKDKGVVGSVTVEGAGDNGTDAIRASTYLVFDSAAWVFASFADALELNGFTTGTDRWTINVPSNAGGAGEVVTIALCNDTDGSTSAGSGVIGIGTSGASAGTVAETVVDAINGFTDSGGTYNHGKAHLGSGISASGVAGVTATLSGSTKVSLTADAPTSVGDAIAVANVAGDVATAGTFSGGGDIALSGANITLTSVDGTERTYTCVAGGANSLLNEFDMGASVTAARTNLTTVIHNTDKGHGILKIIAANPSPDVTGRLNLNQTEYGTQGNLAMSVGGNLETILSTTPGNRFLGGVDKVPITLELEVSLDGISWGPGVTLLSDVDCSVLDTYVGSATATQVPDSPYTRLTLNRNEADVNGLGNTFRSKIALSYKT